jgi:hypothetical protein
MGKPPKSNSFTRNMGVSWESAWVVGGYSYGIDELAASLPEVRTSTLIVGLRHEELALTYSNVAVDAGTSKPSISLYSVRWKYCSET